MKKRIFSMLLAVFLLVGMLPVQVFATEAESAPALGCATEGCTFDADHEGNCSNYVAPAACEMEGCTFEAGHEGNCSNYVAPEEPSADQTAAQQVMDLIAAIGEVTLESEAAITAAESAYNALTDAQKALVTNHDVLEAAKTAYGALSTPVPVVADPVTISVTISDRGNPVMMRKSVTVADYDADGSLDVDDALYAAHEAAYSGGAAAGYACETSQYGLSLTRLWGDVSGCFGYMLNDTPCWSLADPVSAGDYLVAYINKDQSSWSDAYARFAKSSYTATVGTAMTVAVEKGDWDSSYTTYSFSAFDGASVSCPTADVCTVAGYDVTFTKAGTYYLVATAEDPLLVPAVAVVTVTGPSAVVESIELNKTETAITVGGEETLTATVKPDDAADKTVTWTSSDETIATVDANGKVTAVAVGTATITAKAGEKEASCEVSVKPAQQESALSVLKFASGSSATATPYTMTPAFSPAVTEYTLVVPDSTSSVYAWATLGEGYSGDIKANYTNTSGAAKTVTLTSGKTTGTSLSSTVASGKLTGNTVTINVGDEAAYTVKIVRQTTLSKLAIAVGTQTVTLTPTFNATKFEYNADVTHDAVLSVTPTVKSSGTTVTINGGAATSGTATSVTPVWTDRSSDLVIKVSGGEGSVDSTYTIHLAQLATKIEILTPPAKTTYAAGESFDPAGMTLKATYVDGFTETIEKDAFTYAPTGPMSQSVTEIEITFDGLSAKQSITIPAVFEGKGTQAEPYLLKTTEDLVRLSNMVAGGMSFSGEYFKMVNPITLPDAEGDDAWVPLGVDKNKPFSGNFDGGSNLLTVPEGGLPLIGFPAGATLSNLNVYGSKIAGYGVVNGYAVGATIVIDNVTLKSGTQTLQSGFIGGFASSSNVITIKNSTVESGVVIGYDKQQKWIGSFGGEYNGTIDNCVSYAAVYGTDFVGGIVADKGQSVGSFAVTNSKFYGTVVATGNYVGGIVGHGYGGTQWGMSSAPNAPCVTIQNCVSSGSITGGNYVGGILGAEAGVAQCWENGTGYIQNNKFTGTVSATNGSYVGGIIGYMKSLNKNNVISNNYYARTCGASKGIGGVEYVDTSCETHETTSGATYINTANGKPGISGITKTNQNRTDDPLGADAENLCYTDTADLLTSQSVSVSTIHEDASAGNAVTLSFDEQTNTFSGKLSNYTELDAYNDGDISVVIANIPEGATAVLNNDAGEKLADFVDGVAKTTGSTMAASGKYTFKIVLTNGAKTESCDLILEKTTTMKWKGLVFEGIPAFSENIIYNGHPEGTLFQLDADGNRTGAIGLSDDCLHYEVYVNPLTTSVKPEGTKGMDYFKTSFVPNPMNKKTSIYVDDELVIENIPTTLALAMKIAQLENGFELNSTNERTVLRVEFKISDTEVVYSTITFVRDTKVSAAALTTMIEELNLKDLVYPDDVTSVNRIKGFYDALSDEEKAQISAELQSKLAAAAEWANPDRVPEKLEIVKAPAQVAYAAGDPFNPAGVELLATYSDGTTRTITPESEGFTVEPSGALTNETEVTITYNTVKVSQPITVLTINWSGEGTETAPYELHDAEDLQALYTYVASGKTTKGLYFKMMENITLPSNWLPIGVLIDPSVPHINSGKNVYPFSGTLDGNGKTITVPEGGLPLLGHVNGATVKNLNIYGKQIAGYGLVNNLEGVGLSGEAICIDNVTLKSGSSTLKSGLIGTYITNNGFAGCSAAFYVTIKNCTIEKDVVVGYNKDQSMIGSIAGRIHGTIDNCVSYATVYGTSYVGGILGTRDNAMTGCVVTNSQFHGTVEASGTQVGGIVGGGYSNASAPNGSKININNCSVSGSVTGADKVGGIVGADTGVVQLWGTHTLKNNAFSGTVKATGGNAVGGIIGYYLSLNKYDDISGNYYKSGCGADRGIGFVQYVDTSCQTHETAVGATYINTAEGIPDISGITKKDLNRTDDPLGADAAKLCYTDSTPVTATELKVSGNYKTEYTTGDKLDLSGIVLTVVYTDKSEKTINLSDVTVSGYDASKVGAQELTISYNGLTAAITVKVENPKGEISVTVSVLGDSKHGAGAVHTLAGGGLTTWVGATEYTVDSNSTVWDVLQKIFADNGITCNAGSNNSQGTVYISALTRNGVTLAEFDNGPNSGWMYKLNGADSDNGVAQQYLKDGDVIVYHYTDDYTKEQGSMGEGQEQDAKAAEAVEKLIDAIGTVALDSADEIAASRKAYDDLTYAQKQLVDNYAKLTAAESKLAQLKKEADEEAAEKVEDLIDAIKNGSTNFEDDVKAAQKAYNNLTADQKKLVDNYSKLANALKELADEEDKEAAEAVEKLIKDLGTITLDFEDDIKAAREAYDKLTDEQKALVENLDVLEAAEEKLAQLKADAVTEDIYKTTGDYIEDLGTPVPGSIGGEWMVIGLIRSDREVPGADDYYASVVKYVQENIDENERLHRAKSSENSRIILALTAMGKDVTNVDGHNLLNGLNDLEFVQKQGINGPIWALIAFDSGNYPTPEGDVTREALIQIILDAQLADGGWTLSGEVSDADMTGMAVQALAPYYESNADVKKALDEAIQTLSKMQAADGSYGNIDGTSSESVAQVIVALGALGIDADKDTRFIKNGISAVDALCAFYVEGGGFRHLMDGNRDGMATEQGYYALTAYYRMKDGKTGLYNMTDVINMGGDVEAVEPTETLPAETEPAPTEPVQVEDDDKGNFPWWIVIVILVAGAVVVVIVNRKKILQA